MSIINKSHRDGLFVIGFFIMKEKIIASIEQNPIIAAVQSAGDIEKAILSPVSTVFVLCADIFNAQQLVDQVKGAGKYAFLHMDFLSGIGRDERAIDYIAQVIRPSGLISTKNNHIKYAKKNHLFTIQRFFLIDNHSYQNTISNALAVQPDLIEIMPGVMPRVIRRIKDQISIPVIAGGLINSKEDMIEIIKAGALGLSVGNTGLWEL